MKCGEPEPHLRLDPEQSDDRDTGGRLDGVIEESGLAYARSAPHDERSTEAVGDGGDAASDLRLFCVPAHQSVCRPVRPDVDVSSPQPVASDHARSLRHLQRS
jgi:hypothetical protein